MAHALTGNGNLVRPSEQDGVGTHVRTPDEPSQNGTAPASVRTDAEASSFDTLKLKGRLLASLALVIWLNLFAGGIFIDTRPSRCAISPDGVAALEKQANGGNAAGSANPCSAHLNDQGKLKSGRPLFVSWFIAVVFFLPLNLALLCATAGALGTFGSIANLNPDQAKPSSQDKTNPYISGLLRGFFVYLFVISGLLVLEDAPFSEPSPGQYIRLAGFLSLFSFVVNYQPHIFSTLFEIALARISSSKGGAMAVAQNGDDKMAVQGEKVKATENRDGTKTLQAETIEDD